MNQKFLIILSFLLFSSLLSAGTMVVTDGIYTPFSTAIINNQVADIAEDLNDESLIKLAGEQDNFATATNNINSSLILQGSMYTGFDAEKISFSFGSALGVENSGDLQNVAKNMDNGKDEATSLLPGSIVASCIINPAQFTSLPVDGLLINLKGGGMSAELPSGYDLSYSSYMFGGGLIYRVYSFSNTNPQVKMRDLVVSGGVYHNSSSITFIPDDIKKEGGNKDKDDYYTKTKTDLKLQVENSSTVIPLEIATSVSFFNYINLIAGTGVDICFGETTVDVKSNTRVTAYESESESVLETNHPAQLDLTNSKTEVSSPIARFKTILGFAVSFDHVRIEVPVSYYPAAGFTAAIVAGGVF